MDKNSINGAATHMKGVIGELEFGLHLIKAGWNVFKPFNPSARADLVIEKGGIFRKVQIKYCTPYKGCLRVELEHPMRKTKPYSILEVDEVGVFDSVNHKFYLIPLKEILPRKEIWIRVSPLKKNQEKKINLGEKYEI